VATHVGVALVVHEDHAEIGGPRDRLGEATTVHVGMPPRLVHQRGAHVIEVLSEPGAFLEDGGARYARHAGGDDTQRLTGRVGVYRGVGVGELHAHAPVRRSQTLTRAPRHAGPNTWSDLANQIVYIIQSGMAASPNDF